MPKVVCISAGHTKEKAGAVSPDGLEEHAVCLKIVEYAAARLTELGHTVRRCEELDLPHKVSYIRSLASERPVAIEVHCNSATVTSARGIEVIPADDDDSQYLASRIERKLSQLSLPSRGIKPDEFRGDPNAKELYLTHHLEGFCPVVVVECLFMSNPNDAELLANDQWLQWIGEAIAEAV